MRFKSMQHARITADQIRAILNPRNFSTVTEFMRDVDVYCVRVHDKRRNRWVRCDSPVDPVAIITSLLRTAP